MGLGALLVPLLQTVSADAVLRKQKQKPKRWTSAPSPCSIAANFAQHLDESGTARDPRWTGEIVKGENQQEKQENKKDGLTLSDSYFFFFF